MLAVVALALAAAPLTAQQQKRPLDPGESSPSKTARVAAATALPPVLWRDPGDISSFDLAAGPGGKDHAPAANDDYHFLREDLNATSTKFYVQDSHGVRWLVKVAEEAKPETAATRFVWAMGYFADEDYYLERIHVSGMPRLVRPDSAISPDGTVTRVRLKREDDAGDKVANWDWSDNPFAGSRELNGLRVLMALLNNWDLTTSNNKVYVTNGERRFVVSDLGASFGRAGGSATRSKGVLKDYDRSPFIEHVRGDVVDFTMATRPFALKRPFHPAYYKMRVRIEQVAKNIPRADARWMGQLLSRLTAQQIRDAFRGAGYKPDQVEAYAQAVEARIAALAAL